MKLREQLRGVFAARAARLGTLHELTRLAPIAVIAETLGYHPRDHRKARDRQQRYARYIDARLNGRNPA